MSKFNTVTEGSKTTNKAGSVAYKETPQLELLSILLTSFGGDKFYEKSAETFIRLKSLISQCDPLFVAKAIIYARTVFGMRSISHVSASYLAPLISGERWAKNFFDKVVYRPDDMTEIVSFHSGKLSSSMKKGFAMAFSRFDEYSLAKYRSDDKAWKLADVMKLVHPKPNERNTKALNGLKTGELRSFDTWEVELSKAGESEDKEKFKKEAWTKLIREKKLKYFALLRNLRNILEQAPEVLDEALEMLVDPVLIKKSLIMPFSFSTAYDQILALSDDGARKILKALNKAVDLSLSNVPKFEGKTLVVLDVSGSMTQMKGLSKGGSPAQIGALFATVIVKSNEADLITFSDSARYKSLNTDDSTMTIAKSIQFASGATNFHAVFETANKKYDRIILLSDMQGWAASTPAQWYTPPHAAFAEYKKQTGADPKIYSFDLNGYGTLQFPQGNVYCLAGFSDKTMDILKYLESDKKAMINEVNKIEL